MKSIEPEGYKAWGEKAAQTVKEHPEVFNTPEGGVDFVGENGRGKMVLSEVDGRVFVQSRNARVADEIKDEWDGEEDLGPELEGSRTREERKSLLALGKERPGSDVKEVELEPEPRLSIEQ